MIMFRRTIYITWALLLIKARCSVVRDFVNSSESYMNYCPPMGSCPEGSHVLCLYYNPQRVTGVRCFEAMNVTMSRAIATQLLEVANAVRSKIALGKETGKKGKPLPKAYGMNKLQWSNELATFAQIMANQCILRHDLCRATEQFEQPGQTAGLVRFTHPDWKPVSKQVKLPPGLIPEKLTYATTQVLNSWYQNKKYVNPEWIEHCPDWRNEDISTAGKVYLEMIYYKATHMGCGIIGYTEYAYHDNFADVIYNSVQIICNFSAKPIPGRPIYDIHKPNSPGNTVRCGCPIGFEEDSNCLCVPAETQEYCDIKDKKCKVPLVLMPIFTVEDAPQDKTAARYGPNDTRLMVVDQNGPREIRYDMLRPIPNDKDGPHYELIPQEGLSQSLALVPILEQVQNDLPDAKIYWNQADHDTKEPLYGTLTKNKGELPRIELFNDQVDREALALQKYATVKNKEAQLDLARTLLIKSYDDLKHSIIPKRQKENILQIYNEELLKQIAKDESLNNINIQKQDSKKVVMSTKDLILATERSLPQFEFLKVQNDISKQNIISHQRNYLPIVKLPANIQTDQTLSQYMLSQTEGKMPSIRNNLMHIQKKLPALESALVLPKIRPTVSENVKKNHRIEPIKTKTTLSVDIHKDLNNSHDKFLLMDDNQNITKNNIPFEGNSLTPRNKLLDKMHQNSQSSSEYDKIVRQIKSSWPNKSIHFVSNNKMPEKTNHLLVSHKALKITQSGWRVQYGHDYASKSSKSKKTLKESMPYQNVLRSENSDPKLEQNESHKPPLPLQNVVHIKDIEWQFETDNKPLKNQLHHTANRKTDEKILEETQSHTGRYVEQFQFNDNSKLCRLKDGKLTCDVSMERLILKEPIPNSLQSKHQMYEDEGRKITTRFKLYTKERPFKLKRRSVHVKTKSSDKEEISNTYQNFDNEKI